MVVNIKNKAILRFRDFVHRVQGQKFVAVGAESR